MVFVSHDHITFYFLLNKLATLSFVSLLLYSQSSDLRLYLQLPSEPFLACALMRLTQNFLRIAKAHSWQFPVWGLHPASHGSELDINLT